MAPPLPYDGLAVSDWSAKTKELIEEHPLDPDEIVEVVLGSWDSILGSTLGSKPFEIGVDIFPKPQIMAFLLHELVPLELEIRHPGDWRGELTAQDKDLVYVPDDQFSVELKASSSKGHIYGNRSYAQQPTKGKKSKDGYYFAINFGKFDSKGKTVGITQIRFGWLDHTDWQGQVAPTGQQARLSNEVERFKLATLYKG